jgi:hypothetical protein
MFYAAINTYATETDMGFSNTWGVLAFETRAARDAYIDSADDLATRAITRRAVTQYVSRKPRPFTGERYIIEHTPRTLDGCAPDGMIGAVAVGSPDDACYIRDLNQ